MTGEDDEVARAVRLLIDASREWTSEHFPPASPQQPLHVPTRWPPRIPVAQPFEQWARGPWPPQPRDEVGGSPRR